MSLEILELFCVFLWTSLEISCAKNSGYLSPSFSYARLAMSDLLALVPFRSLKDANTRTAVNNKARKSEPQRKLVWSRWPRWLRDFDRVLFLRECIGQPSLDSRSVNNIPTHQHPFGVCLNQIQVKHGDQKEFYVQYIYALQKDKQTEGFYSEESKIFIQFQNHLQIFDLKSYSVLELLPWWHNSIT